MNPAALGITEGIQDAFAYLQQTWRMWLPVVIAIAVCSFGVYAIVGSTDTSTIYHVDPDSNQVVWNQDALVKVGGRFVAATAATGLVGLIGSWVFNAVAIGGLRHRPLTISWIVTRGLVTVLAGIVVGVACVLAVVVLALVTVAVPPLGVILILVAIPVGIYFAIRLVFYSLAIFDGFGPIDGLWESWRLSDGAVARMLGWGLMAVLISLAFGVLAGVIAPLAGGTLQPLGQALSTAITTIGSCFTIFMMAVLYESQRARLDPSLYPYTPGPFYPAGPYAPGQYPAGPAWPGTPPPATTGAIPGWVNPNSGPAWPAYPPAYPKVPLAPGANPGAGPAWVPGEPDQTPPSEPKPTDPPASP
jgi:hypothetical protein